MFYRVFLPLLKRDQHGRLVVIIRTAAHNPQLHLQNNVLKVGKMTLDLAVEKDESISVYGVTAIFDLNATTFSHATQMTPSIIRKAVHAWQVCCDSIMLFIIIQKSDCHHDNMAVTNVSTVVKIILDCFFNTEIS